MEALRQRTRQIEQHTNICKIFYIYKLSLFSFLQRCTSGPPQGRNNDRCSRTNNECFMHQSIRDSQVIDQFREGNPANLADMTGNYTYARETRAHADSRQTCKAICPGSLSNSPSERYAFGMIYSIFTLQQKPIWSHAREGVSTSGIYQDKRDAFLQPMRFERRYFRARELRA